MKDLVNMYAALVQLKVTIKTLSAIHQELLKTMGTTDEGKKYCDTLEHRIKGFKENHEKFVQYSQDYEKYLILRRTLTKRGMIGMYIAGGVAILIICFKKFIKK